VSAPPSPPARRLRAPRWLDGRLVAGIVLVLVSVVVGARLVAAAGATTRVYAAAADLALGSQLTAADVTTVRSRLFDSGHSYVDAAGPSPVGRVLVRPVSRGELLPVRAVADERALPPTRLVTVPLSRLHVPPEVDHGALVDVFATYGENSQPTRTVALLRRVVVERTVRPGTGALAATAADTALVLRVPPEQAATLVAAVQTAKIDVAQVVADAPGSEVGSEPVLTPGATGGGSGAVGSGVPTAGVSASGSPQPSRSAGGTLLPSRTP
jgi:SAF domain